MDFSKLYDTAITRVILPSKPQPKSKLTQSKLVKLSEIQTVLPNSPPALSPLPPPSLSNTDNDKPNPQKKKVSEVVVDGLYAGVGAMDLDEAYESEAELGEELVQNKSKKRNFELKINPEVTDVSVLSTPGASYPVPNKTNNNNNSKSDTNVKKKKRKQRKKIKSEGDPEAQSEYESFYETDYSEAEGTNTKKKGEGENASALLSPASNVPPSPAPSKLNTSANRKGRPPEQSLGSFYESEYESDATTYTNNGTKVEKKKKKKRGTGGKKGGKEQSLGSFYESEGGESEYETDVEGPKDGSSTSVTKKKKKKNVNKSGTVDDGYRSSTNSNYESDADASARSSDGNGTKKKPKRQKPKKKKDEEKVAQELLADKAKKALKSPRPKLAAHDVALRSKVKGREPQVSTLGIGNSGSFSASTSFDGGRGSKGSKGSKKGKSNKSKKDNSGSNSNNNASFATPSSPVLSGGAYGNGVRATLPAPPRPSIGGAAKKNI